MIKQKKTKVRVYTLSSVASLKGFVKDGLDTSTIVNIIVAFDSNYEEYKKRGFTFPPHQFFFHELSWREAEGVLINRHKLTKDEAKESLKTLEKQFNLTRIKRTPSDDAFEKLAGQANEKAVTKSNNERLQIGVQDTIIIGGFLREKINMIHSEDGWFLATCKELGMNTTPLPKSDKEKEDRIKKFMKMRKT